MARVMSQSVRLGVVVVSLMLAACPATNPLTGSTSSTDMSYAEGGAPAQSSRAVAPKTAAEKQLEEDEKRFYSTMMGGAAIGALAGAGVGVAGCHLAGYRDARLRNCIAAATVTGGLLGGVDGYLTGKREAAGKNELRAIQATTADVQQDNAKLKSFLDNSNRVLKEGQVRLAALRGDLAKRQVTAAQADEALKREEQNIALMNKTLENAKQTRNNYAAASKKLQGDPKAKRDLDVEIQRMNEQIAQLERNVAEYNRALTVSRA